MFAFSPVSSNAEPRGNQPAVGSKRARAYDTVVEDDNVSLSGSEDDSAHEDVSAVEEIKTRFNLKRMTDIISAATQKKRNGLRIKFNESILRHEREIKEIKKALDMLDSLPFAKRPRAAKKSPEEKY
jgi:hypothetical protein